MSQGGRTRLASSGLNCALTISEMEKMGIAVDRYVINCAFMSNVNKWEIEDMKNIIDPFGEGMITCQTEILFH